MHKYDGDMWLHTLFVQMISVLVNVSPKQHLYLVQTEGVQKVTKVTNSHSEK